jgi:protein-arginine kinase activator protein McsA
MKIIQPIMWDGESYCARCTTHPAIVELPYGMADDKLVVELVCLSCATKENEDGV